MKRASFNAKIFFPLVMLVFFADISCRKYIYQAPITSTYSAVFWTSENSVEQAAASMYGLLRANLRKNASFFVNGDYVSGSFHYKQQDYKPLTSNLNPFPGGPFLFTYAPNMRGALHDWSRFYQLIAQCNLILQKVPEMSSSLFTSEAKKNAYIAEALFMRAYAYFYMIRIWGDPVYVGQTYNDVDYGNIPPIARSPEAVVLDSCITDLKTAAGYLNFTAGDPVKAVRANKGGAYALMAHIYAWKHDYAKAHEACLEVINNGGYKLEPLSTYKNIWNGKSSRESIFELSMVYDSKDSKFRSQGEWAEAQYNFFGTFLKNTFVNNYRNTAWISPYDFVNDLMDTARDARYDQVFSYTPALGGDEKGYLLTKYVNFLYYEPDTRTLPYINNNLVLFRLSDILLIDAEALASTGDLPGAASRLSQTQVRAQINSYKNPTNQFEMLDEIIKERGRELVGEGHWFYDLIRTQPVLGWLERVGYQSERVNNVNKGYYWPLNMGLLFPQNNLLTQNPWWSKNP